MFLSSLFRINRSYLIIVIFVCIDCFDRHMDFGDVIIEEIKELYAISQTGGYDHAAAYVDYFLYVLMYSLRVSTQYNIQCDLLHIYL